MAAPGLVSGPTDERAISVDLVTAARLLTPPPRSALRADPPKKRPLASPSAALSGPPLPADVTAGVFPHPAAAPANPSQENRPTGLALRNSTIGCAFAGPVELNDAQRRHCQDMFAAGRKGGPDLASLGIDPGKRAAFDAAADRANFLQKPFLSARPKNGCKPFIDHQQYASLGGSRDAYSVALGCAKTF